MDPIEERIISDAKAGYSNTEISKVTHLPPTTVTRILSAHNVVAVTEPKGTKGRRFSQEELSLLTTQGLTIAQVASALNIGYSNARYWLDKYDLSTHVKACSWRENG